MLVRKHVKKLAAASVSVRVGGLYSFFFSSFLATFSSPCVKSRGFSDHTLASRTQQLCAEDAGGVHAIKAGRVAKPSCSEEMDKPLAQEKRN